MKNAGIVLCVLLAFTSVSFVKAQNCPVNSVPVNTGYNHYTNTTYNDGLHDAYWQVVADPDNQTTEPRPANVIAPNSSWSGAFSSTKWICAYPSSGSAQSGLYEFEYKFCLYDISNVSLTMQLRADDTAAVYVNGHYVLSTQPPTSGFNAFNDPNPHSVTITSSNFSHFAVGSNVIRVKVQNTQGVVMGLNMTGSVTGGSATIDQPECCTPFATVTGIKWNDITADGVKSTDEPVMDGWAIVLTNTATNVSYSATTDITGAYYFYVPAGSYTVSEVGQSGWVQTYPSQGTYTLTVTGGNVYSSNDFGNHFDPDLPCENCIGSFAPEPGKTYIISAWVKEDNAPPTKTSYDRPQIVIEYPPLSTTSPTFTAKGAIIDGWQRIEEEFTIPGNATHINMKLDCATGDCYYDDIRIFPVDGTMKTYVFDPVTLRLVAELDERNYATFYEYDEEGKLVRVKKETERGVMTIQENKNSSKKRQP